MLSYIICLKIKLKTSWYFNFAAQCRVSRSNAITIIEATFQKYCSRSFSKKNESTRDSGRNHSSERLDILKSFKYLIEVISVSGTKSQEFKENVHMWRTYRPRWAISRRKWSR